MVLDLFTKSPEVGRMLVRLHDRNKLYNLAKNPDDMACTELIQTIVDLLEHDLKPAESELISDVLMGLIKQAEIDLRRSLSERLAVMEDVPLRLVLKLATDEIFVADPILRKSKDLKDFDLIYIIKANKEEHWRSIAMRSKIATKVVDMLAETGDEQTACNLIENKSISLSENSLAQFFDMAKESEKLAKPLLLRHEIKASLVSEIYKFVGDEIKGFIRDNFELESPVDKVVDQVTIEFVNNDSVGEAHKDAVNDFELMQQRGLLTPSVMVENLKRGQVKNFVAQFAVYCGLPNNVAQEMIEQEVGQSLAIACKACHISKSDFTNIYLLTSRVRKSRLVEENNLSRAMLYYDKVTEDMATKLMKQYRH